MLWLDNDNISIIFSEKSNGDILFKTQHPELNGKIRQNRISFFKKNNINPNRLVNPKLNHGDNIFTIARDSTLRNGSLDEETRIKGTDGLITDIKNSYLMITGADCFPVLFYDPAKNVIAAAHCGWQGVLKELPAKMISKLVNDFGSNPTDIQVWIGPGIKSCHFSKTEDVVELFAKKYSGYIGERDAQYESGRFINLIGIIKSQLIKAGVILQNISEHPDCTYCQKDKYFSYRRDKPEIVEANAYIIKLK